MAAALRLPGGTGLCVCLWGCVSATQSLCRTKFFPTQTFTFPPLSPGTTLCPRAAPQSGVILAARREALPGYVRCPQNRGQKALGSAGLVRKTNWSSPGAQPGGLAPPGLAPRRSEGLCTGCFPWLHTPAFQQDSLASFRSLLTTPLPSPCFMFLHSTYSHVTYYVSVCVSCQCQFYENRLCFVRGCVAIA